MRLLWSEVIAFAGMIVAAMPNDLSDRIGAVCVSTIVFVGVRVLERTGQIVPWEE